MLDPAADRIVVFPRQKFLGLASLAPEFMPPVGEYLSFTDAFTKKHLCDAHFVLYHVLPFDESVGPWRLRKAIVHDINKAGGRVLVYYLVVEYDTGVGKAHVSWTQESYQAFLALLESLEGSPLG